MGFTSFRIHYTMGFEYVKGGEVKEKETYRSMFLLVGEVGLDLHFRRERKLRCCRRPAADK